MFEGQLYTIIAICYIALAAYHFDLF